MASTLISRAASPNERLWYGTPSPKNSGRKAADRPQDAAVKAAKTATERHQRLFGLLSQNRRQKHLVDCYEEGDVAARDLRKFRMNAVASLYEGAPPKPRQASALNHWTKRLRASRRYRRFKYALVCVFPELLD